MKSSRRVALGTTFGALVSAPTYASDRKAAPGGAIHVSDFGAVGDGIADDSAAIAAACRKAIKKMQSGTSCFLKFGSGRFLIRDTTLPLFERVPVGIRGEGPSQTIIVIDPNYSGDVFSWSDCWDASSYGAKIRAPQYSSGLFIEDIAFLGNLDRTSIVHAISLYDINDNVRISNVQFDYINGSAMRLGGLTKAGSFGIIRESRVSEVRAFCCGTREFPVIDVGSSGSSDATNEIIFNSVDIFRPGGDGLVITNKGSRPVRLFKIFGLRVERFINKSVGLRIGDENGIGEIYGLNIFGVEMISGEKGSIAIALLGKSDRQIIGTYLQGQIINCHGDGVLVTAGKYNKIDFLLNDSLGKAVTLTQTKAPLYYSSQNSGRIFVDAGCTLLMPSYFSYK